MVPSTELLVDSGELKVRLILEEDQTLAKDQARSLTLVVWPRGDHFELRFVKADNIS